MKLMLFADDIFIWGKNKREVQDQINEWAKVAKEYRLNFSAEKREMERNNSESSVTMDGQHLKKVDQFKYLGRMISKDGAMDKDINKRIELSSGFYNTVKDLIWNTHVPLKCKKTIYQTYFVPTLTYG
jgi:Reverse transcriptase (RNA-dependent DNA polymerase).